MFKQCLRNFPRCGQRSAVVSLDFELPFCRERRPLGVVTFIKGEVRLEQMRFRPVFHVPGRLLSREVLVVESVDSRILVVS